MTVGGDQGQSNRKTPIDPHLRAPSSSKNRKNRHLQEIRCRLRRRASSRCWFKATSICLNGRREKKNRTEVSEFICKNVIYDESRQQGYRV
jgi:hypothetical protein